MSDINCEFPNNLFRPTNQLPFPAVKGMVLMTNSDFTLPARPDLLVWKTRESVIGVENITMTWAENKMSVTFYKLVDNETIEIGTIGIIEKEQAEKVLALDFVAYELRQDISTHKASLIGIDKDKNEKTISTISLVDYENFYNKIIEIETNIEVLDKKVDINKKDADDKIQVLDEKVEKEIDDRKTADTNLDKKIEDEITNRKNEDIKIDTKIDETKTELKNNIDNNYNFLNEKIETNTNTLNEKIDTKEIILKDEIKKVDDKYQPTKDTQENIIKPVIDILKLATSGGLVLAKAQNGVDIEWLNKLSLENVEAVVNNETHTIVFYKTINGQRFEFLTLDKVDYATIQDISNRLYKLDDDIYETAEPNYVLTKNQNGKDVDFKKINNVLNFTNKIENNYLYIYLNEQEIFKFEIPNLDGKYIIDNFFGDDDEDENTRFVIKDKDTNINILEETITKDNLIIRNTKSSNPSQYTEVNYDFGNIRNKISQHDIEIAEAQADIVELKEDKQNKLIAGDNITIDEETNTISASGGGQIKDYEFFLLTNYRDVTDHLDREIIDLNVLSLKDGRYRIYGNFSNDKPKYSSCNVFLTDLTIKNGEFLINNINKPSNFPNNINYKPNKININIGGDLYSNNHFFIEVSKKSFEFYVESSVEYFFKNGFLYAVKYE